MPPADRPTSRNVTLADVARYAGVSSAVVSYVVNDGPRPVAPGTAARVREAIEVLGYRPNSHARALRNGSTGIFGLVHPGSGNPFFGEFNDVIYDSATRAGVALLTASSAGRVDTEQQLIEDLTRRSVDGLIVVTSMAGFDVSQLQEPSLPTVFLDCPFPIPGHRTIGPNGADGARQLVDHLVSHHDITDIALIAGDTGSPEPDDRELGWRHALLAHGLMPGEVVRTDFGIDGGYEGARALLARPRPPEAIFVSSDLQAYGVLHAVHEQLWRIPQDVAVVSFDGNIESAHTWPPLTLVRQPMQAMADAAISALVTRRPPGHQLFEMELIVRQSCGCARQDPPPAQVRHGVDEVPSRVRGE